MLLKKIHDFSLSYPNQIAVIENDINITYRELILQCKKVAQCIKNKSIPVETCIPVTLPRGIEYVIAVLGILYAGCAFTPLSDSYPEERKKHIMKDCNALFCIDKEFMHQALSLKISDIQYSLQEPEEEQLSYIIYTSGSTGNPKGAMHPYKNLCSFVESLSEALPFYDEEKYASTMAYTFTGMCFDILFNLYNGISIHIVPDNIRKDSRLLQNFIEENNITSCIISPQLLKNFSLDKPIGNLKKIFTGSEKVDKLYSPHFHIYNLYGQSECVQAVTIFDIDQCYENTPLGTALNDINLYLLDENLTPVQDGIVGEICISGRIAEGYINMTNETKNVFIPNPFYSIDGCKTLFKTNDLGMRLIDGNIIYVNRKDWMIKINGHRIEPGEIETVLMNYEYILQSVVKAFENSAGTVRLCAYYTASKECPTEEIIEFLTSKLPEYMIPHYFIRLDKFPLNESNKIDRMALLPPDMENTKSNYIKPETDLEKLFCSAFENVLKLTGIGADDDFFELGGDSISAVQLCLEVEKNLSSFMDMTILYEQKTPKKIAARLESNGIKYVSI